MNLRFISDGPALLVQNKKRILVIADLHFGIESDLARHGWHFPSKSAERIHRLCTCISEQSPDMVVLLGDVKHNIPSATRQEYRELPGIIATIRDLAPVSVLPGNHDVGIGRFFPDSELLPKNGAVIDGVGYLHGHTIPAPGLFGRLIIAGHHHPMVSLYDEVGCALQAPAYLLAGLDDSRSLTAERDGIWQTTRVLFMPAFNECAGFDILRIVNYPFSPLSRSIQRDSAEVFLCDGTFVGPVSLLEKADAAA